jgi:hypothetical protein
MSAAPASSDLRYVEADLNYSVRTAEKPVSETYGREGLERRYIGRFEKQRVRIADARPLADKLHLETNGFELVEHTTRMKDFFDIEELRTVYYAEMRALIARQSGATRVHIFDHTLRSGDEDDRNAKKIREPVKAVHNDYTEWSGPQRVRDLMGAEAETLIGKHFAIVQTWRAVREPVAKDPLAIADARSIAFADFIPAERRFPDRVGEIYQLAFSPNHRWHYFPLMHRDEALVFKVYDSKKDVARFSAHTSFDDPTSPPDARPRESIEIRAFAFFDV